jgi:hypothetical protein
MVSVTYLAQKNVCLLKLVMIFFQIPSVYHTDSTLQKLCV